MYTRPDSFPPMVKNLIIINVIVWIAQLIFDRQGTDLTGLLALLPIGNGFKPYQVATHMFAHSAYDPFGRLVLYHIAFNMLVLWMFGRVLENFWGPKRFLLFYLLCGVGAAVAHLTVQYFTHGNSAAIGASGAIMGLMAAYAYLFPNSEMYMMFLPIPIKAKWAVIGLAALDLFGGLAGGNDGVGHFAHLGGAVTGLIIVFIWNRNRRRFY